MFADKSCERETSRVIGNVELDKLAVELTFFESHYVSHQCHDQRKNEEDPQMPWFRSSVSNGCSCTIYYYYFMGSQV